MGFVPIFAVAPGISAINEALRLMLFQANERGGVCSSRRVAMKTRSSIGRSKKPLQAAAPKRAGPMSREGGSRFQIKRRKLGNGLLEGNDLRQGEAQCR